MIALCRQLQMLEKVANISFQAASNTKCNHLNNALTASVFGWQV
jgi:hypothetical protein